MGRIAGIIERIADLQARLGALDQVTASGDGLPAEFAALLLQQTTAPDAALVTTGLEDLLPTESPGEQGDAWSAGSAQTFDAIISQAAARWNLSPELVHAVVRAESDYDPKCLSRAGAMGLMQLMPETARDVGVTDPWNPVQNLNGGCRYLRAQLDRFGRLELALAAYNAGPGAVRRYGGIPPYRETRAYVKRVLGYLQQLTRAAGTPATRVTPPWETAAAQPVSQAQAHALTEPGPGAENESESRLRTAARQPGQLQQTSDQPLPAGLPPSIEGQAYVLEPATAPAPSLTHGPRGEARAETGPAPALRTAALAADGESPPVAPEDAASRAAPSVPSAKQVAQSGRETLPETAVPESWPGVSHRPAPDQLRATGDGPSVAPTATLLREGAPVLSRAGLQPHLSAAGEAEASPYIGQGDRPLAAIVAQRVTGVAAHQVAAVAVLPGKDDGAGPVLAVLFPIAQSPEATAGGAGAQAPGAAASASAAGGNPAAGQAATAATDRAATAATAWAATVAADGSTDGQTGEQSARLARLTLRDDTARASRSGDRVTTAATDRSASALRSASPSSVDHAADGAATAATNWGGPAAAEPGRQEGASAPSGNHESVQTAARPASRSAGTDPSQAPQRLVVHVESSGGPVSITAEGHQDRVAAHLSVADWHEAQYLRSQEPALRSVLQSDRVTLGSFDVTDGGHRGAAPGSGSGSQAWPEQAFNASAGGGLAGSEARPSPRATAQTTPDAGPRTAQVGQRLLDLMV